MRDEIVSQAKFNGTRFMTVAQFNLLPSTDRANINGKCYVKNGHKWMKAGFPVKKKVATFLVRIAA